MVCARGCAHSACPSQTLVRALSAFPFRVAPAPVAPPPAPFAAAPVAVGADGVVLIRSGMQTPKGQWSTLSWSSGHRPEQSPAEADKQCAGSSECFAISQTGSEKPQCGGTKVVREFRPPPCRYGLAITRARPPSARPPMRYESARGPIADCPAHEPRSQPQKEPCATPSWTCDDCESQPHWGHRFLLFVQGPCQIAAMSSDSISSRGSNRHLTEKGLGWLSVGEPGATVVSGRGTAAALEGLTCR